MAEDELAARRRAKQRASEQATAQAATATMPIEEIGREMLMAYLASQRAVALEESETKLEILWRDVERWTEAYVIAVRQERDGLR